MCTSVPKPVRALRRPTSPTPNIYVHARRNFTLTRTSAQADYSPEFSSSDGMLILHVGEVSVLHVCVPVYSPSTCAKDRRAPSGEQGWCTHASITHQGYVLYALSLQISRTLVELHWACRRRHHEAQPCLPPACLVPNLAHACQPACSLRDIPHNSQQTSGCCRGQNARRLTVTVLCLMLSCGLHTSSCALRFEEKPARTMSFCSPVRGWGEKTDDTLPSLLAIF